MVDEAQRLVSLDQARDFKVADGDPDVRGWTVVASDGGRIGKVSDLLVDPAAMKARYLSVKLDDTEAAAPEGRQVLVPVGYARLDPERQQVRMDRLSATQVSALPPYARGALSREYETRLRTHLDPGYSSSGSSLDGADFYASALYDDEHFSRARGTLDQAETRLTLSEEELAIGTREHVAGEVVITKRVEKERVREPVQVMREDVTTERRPAPEGMGTEPRTVGDEILIPIVEEELVVQKRRVVREVLVVRKRAAMMEEVVEAELSREEVDVRREGGASVRGME